MKKDIHQILTILKKITPLIKKKYHVDSIEVFGSYIRNKQKTKSDLDILVTFIQIPSLLKFVELENYLSDTIGIKVDLVMKDSIKPRLRDSILSSAIPV
jgi:predicted nucleotidyltransferase